MTFAERVSGRQLDSLFHAWLFTATRPAYPGTAAPAVTGRGGRMPNAVISLQHRLAIMAHQVGDRCGSGGEPGAVSPAATARPLGRGEALIAAASSTAKHSARASSLIVIESLLMSNAFKSRCLRVQHVHAVALLDQRVQLPTWLGGTRHKCAAHRV